jgi:DNA (cytosine-5)-methyltransferase 1
MEVKVLDLFSGAGGFSKGIEMAGHTITKHYFSEIDKHAIANYLYNFKNAEYYGSVTNVQGRRNEVDIITFGSPCQDFSLAGKRKGMEGERSSLIREAIRLIDEIRPSVFVWENVKGTFSSNNGADFWGIIAAFANIGGYRLEWQLLNTSWFLPQNRERIYLIGHLAGRSERGVFPIGEEDKINYERKKIRNIYDCTRCLTTRYAQDDSTGSFIKIKSNTKKGYEEAKEGDSINFSVPTSKTRRGRVGKGKAQTLDTQCNQGVIEKTNIRRLTQIECERLQGFPDDWTKYGIYDGKVKEIPKTQRYKLMGNAVTTKVVAEIFRRIKLK